MLPQTPPSIISGPLLVMEGSKAWEHRGLSSVCFLSPYDLTELDPVAMFRDVIIQGDVIPEARMAMSCCSTFDDPDTSSKHGHKMFIFGGADLSHKKMTADLFSFDFETRKWERCEIMGGRPPLTINGHSAVMYKGNSISDSFHSNRTGSMWVFGGKAQSYMSELSEYDLDTKIWCSYRKHSPAVHASDLEPPATVIKFYRGKAPSKRYGHSAVVYGDAMYICGGYDQHGLSCGDIHRFDFITHTWSEIHVIHASLTNTHAPLPSFWGHTAVVHGSCMYIFGGKSESGYGNRLFEFSFSSNVMAEIRGEGKTPTPRCGHRAGILRGNMYLYGGSDAATCYSDFYTFDFRSRWWRRQVASDNMTSRARHGGCTYSNRFYVFGGSNGHNFLFNDLKEHVIDRFEESSPNTFLSDILHMLDSDTSFCDITFNIKDSEEENEPKHIRAHKSILAARCEPFRIMFNRDMFESRNGIVNIEDVSYKVFLTLLRYLYGASIPVLYLEEEEATSRRESHDRTLSLPEVLELMRSSDRYLLHHLKRECGKLLQKCVQVNNVISFYRTAQMYNAQELEEYCFRYMLVNFGLMVAPSAPLADPSDADRALLSQLILWMKH
ncbi:hypothetical protein PROFUN_02656 [Planoprotostelium fungivorum]|uniref:BTB domain-containing protein n=1 Tax=Planoprotostelium fungivorum TaxID=1890364 RepID=A0A2P6NVC0_9EUKA|nr:hypothetical protein PROFUN_02656 [Planoprotostelium fungivorum]